MVFLHNQMFWGLCAFFIAQALMGQIRSFVAKLIMSRIRVFLVFFGLRLCRIYALSLLIRFCRDYALFCPDIYSDIEDFTQILCRYLPKKLAAKTSGCRNWDRKEQ